MGMFNSFNSAAKAAAPPLANAAALDRRYNTEKDASDLAMVTDTVSGAVSLFNPVIGAGMKLLADGVAGSNKVDVNSIDSQGQAADAGGEVIGNMSMAAPNLNSGARMQDALREFGQPKSLSEDPFNYKF